MKSPLRSVACGFKSGHVYVFMVHVSLWMSDRDAGGCWGESGCFFGGLRSLSNYFSWSNNFHSSMQAEPHVSCHYLYIQASIKFIEVFVFPYVCLHSNPSDSLVCFCFCWLVEIMQCAWTEDGVHDVLFILFVSGSYCLKIFYQLWYIYQIGNQFQSVVSWPALVVEPVVTVSPPFPVCCYSTRCTWTTWRWTKCVFHSACLFIIIQTPSLCLLFIQLFNCCFFHC